MTEHATPIRALRIRVDRDADPDGALPCSLWCHDDLFLTLLRHLPLLPTARVDATNFPLIPRAAGTSR